MSEGRAYIGLPASRPLDLEGHLHPTRQTEAEVVRSAGVYELVRSVTESSFPKLSAVVEEATAHTRSPYDMVLTCACASMGAAVIGVADVEYEPGEAMTTGTITHVPAGLGVGKTTVFNYFMEPFKSYQSRLNEMYRKRQIQYQLDMDVWTAKKSALSRLYRVSVSSDEGEAQSRALLESHLALRPVAPEPVYLILTDGTPQALHRASRAPMPFNLFSDEGDFLLSGRAFDSVAFMNKGWDGDPYTHALVGDGVISSQRLRFNVLCMAQPSAYQQFMVKKGRKAKELGFFDRAIFCRVSRDTAPPPHRDPNADSQVTEWFRARVKALLDEAVDISEGKKNRRLVCLSPEARNLLIDVEGFLREKVNAGGRYSEAVGYVSKFNRNAVRLAAIIHTFMEFEGDISYDTLALTCIIMKSSLEEYLDIFSGHAGATFLAESLDRNLQYFRNAGMRMVSKSYFEKYGVVYIRDAESLDVAASNLKRSGKLGEVIRGKSKRYYDLFPGSPIQPGLIYWDEKEMADQKRQDSAAVNME